MDRSTVARVTLLAVALGVTAVVPLALLFTVLTFVIPGKVRSGSSPASRWPRARSVWVTSRGAGSPGPLAPRRGTCGTDPDPSSPTSMKA